MTDQEFTTAIRAIIAGVPSDVAVTRLAHLVRALVESGGDPAAGMVRMIVEMRRRIDEDDDSEAGRPGTDMGLFQ
jgi:hypothetical protein